MEEKKKKLNLRIIIPVIIAIVVLAVVGTIILTNKHKGTSGETKNESSGEMEKEIKIGETFTKGEWEYTVNSIEYDYILENIQSIDGEPYKDFMTPKNKYKKTDYSKIDLAKEAERTGNPYCSKSKDSKYAVVSIKCKYNGKNEIKIAPEITFEYDGYTFKQEYRSCSVNEKNWSSMPYLVMKPLPEKETIGYFRIATLLPTNITEGNKKPLVLIFSDNGNKFKININNEKILDYTK